MGTQLDLFAGPPDPPMETDAKRGIYFWAHTRAGGIDVTFSNRPHPRLAFFCPIHRWYSTHRCDADHSIEGIARLIEHREQPPGRTAHVETE
jgi:hypothetical protein